MRLWLLSLLAGTAIECIEAIALPAAAQGGLSLAVYNNTVLAGAPVTATIQELDFHLPLNGFHSGVSLHINDHLVCQFGGNVVVN